MDSRSQQLHRKDSCKLDVLNSRQVNRLTLINLVALSLATGYIIFACVLYNVTSKELKLPFHDGRQITIKEAVELKALKGISITLGISRSILSFIIALLFTIRIIRNRRSEYFPITQQQIWVIMLVITTSLYLNPLVNIWNLHDILILKIDLGNPDLKQSAWVRQPWFRTFLTAAWTTRSLGSTITHVFYIWAAIHSYGLEKHPTGKRELIRFYFPKLLPIGLYQALRVVARYPFNVVLSQLPFSNLVGMITNFSILGVWYPRVVTIILALTVFEIYFVVCIVMKARQTWAKLGRANYIVTRSRQIGYRFFFAHNVIYYLLLIFADTLPTPIIPRSEHLRFLAGNMKLHVFTGSTNIVVDTLFILNVAITAYVNLPPDSNGIRGWFYGSTNYKNVENREVCAQSLSLRRKESQIRWDELSGEVVYDASVHTNSLVLETHVSCLNLSWIAYEWSTGKRGRTVSRQRLFAFKIREHIKDETTDTHLIVVDGRDRIVLAFKGATSMLNLRTGLKMLTIRLSDVLPTISSAHAHYSSEYKFARIHKGFGTAYSTVSKRIIETVQQMLDERRRPVFLTGHSLGGALATICSLDLRMSLDIPPSELCVSTFGSPRCGNRAFRSFYDKAVPLHWRFAMEADIVTKLPKFYSHVGKPVVLTSTGDMFLDPNALETILWSGEVASVRFHRKPAYMLGLRAFCRKYLTGFEPDFWDFQVDEADYLAWEDACAVTLRSRVLSKLHMPTLPSSVGYYPNKRDVS